MIHKFISGALVIVASAALAAQTSSRYDRAAEKTVSGTIKAIVSYRAPDGSVGVHFDLTTADGMVNVHVGPATYIGQQNFWFFADDPIEIIGARMVEGGTTAIWPKAIMKGSAMLALRNDDGTPKWTPATDGADGCGIAHPALPRATEY
jgi:hypothetical protein